MEDFFVIPTKGGILKKADASFVSMTNKPKSGF
jgi:hypothetical protein